MSVATAARMVMEERPKYRLLTTAERQVADYIMQGCRNKEIAQHLGTTEQVIKNRVRNIMLKLCLDTRVEVAVTLVTEQLGK